MAKKKRRSVVLREDIEGEVAERMPAFIDHNTPNPFKQSRPGERWFTSDDPEEQRLMDLAQAEAEAQIDADIEALRAAMLEVAGAPTTARSTRRRRTRR